MEGSVDVSPKDRVPEPASDHRDSKRQKLEEVDVTSDEQTCNPQFILLDAAMLKLTAAIFFFFFFAQIRIDSCE